MSNSHAIHIRTDGAMDRDTGQTGGTGFVIEFPEPAEILPIHESFRRDNQGIHRLEMIAILEGMETLIKWIDNHDWASLDCSRVIIHTDRHSITDTGLSNAWKVAGWRRNGWRNYEGKPIKDKDIISSIDKTRKKLSNRICGRVEIVYVRRKKNKKADKLSKQGKKGEARSRKIIREKNVKVAKRLFDGDEIDYGTLKIGDRLEVRVYRKDPVQKEYEIGAEISDGDLFGKRIKVYVDFMQEIDLHRHHYYEIVIDNVYKHHVRIRSDFEEVSHDPAK